MLDLLFKRITADVHRFYCETKILDATSITLDLNETKHLKTVLRHNIADKIIVFDGSGKEYLCEIESFDQGRTVLKIIQENTPSVESKVHITLAFAVLKGQKNEFVVEKATELGVKEIVPFLSKRTIVSFSSEKDKIAKKEKWEKKAVEAIKQCQRTFIPTIQKPMQWDEFLKYILSEKYDLKIFGNENLIQDENISLKKRLIDKENISKILAVVGPEGGFEEKEVEQLEAIGVSSVSLGKRILRADTASISLLAALFFNYDW